MATLTVAAFISKWTSKFASTGNRTITGAFMREFKDDIADSFQSVLGATTVTSWKDPCVVATTVDITLSGEQTIDGVLTSASRVLVKDQTNQEENGIYVSAAGAWTRATDSDDASELEGAAVTVTQGDTNKNTIWIQTTDNITLDTSAIVWQQQGYAPAGLELIDEDDMASDSATKVPSQQSVKAYVDAQVGGISEATAGTYTPTISSTTNLDSSSVADVFNYVRTGDMVTVSGFLLLNPTTTDTLTELHLSLPIASDFTTGYELGGIVNTTVSNDFVGGNASADTVNNNAYVSYKTKTAGSHSLFVQFTYKVVV